MSSTERNAWQDFMLVVYGFLGEKGDIYKETGGKFDWTVSSFCRISMKFYVLHSYWDYFWVHWGDVSKEHGELSPQDSEVKKKR